MSRAILAAACVAVVVGTCGRVVEKSRPSARCGALFQLCVRGRTCSSGSREGFRRSLAIARLGEYRGARPFGARGRWKSAGHGPSSRSRPADRSRSIAQLSTATPTPLRLELDRWNLAGHSPGCLLPRLAPLRGDSGSLVRRERHESRCFTMVTVRIYEQMRSSQAVSECFAKDWTPAGDTGVNVRSRLFSRFAFI
jgi:hypothetical protein